MVSIAEIVFIIVVCAVLLTDFIVFTQAKTYKSWTSLLISVCLGLDLTLRLIQLSVRTAPETTDPLIFFHDCTQYLIDIIALTLLAQWSWIYQVLDNPELA